MALPNLFYQVGFGLAFLNTLLVLWTVCKLIHILPGLGPLSQRHAYSIALSSTCFNYLLIKACPWVKLRGLPELEQAWAQMAAEGAAPFVIANHNSKLDSLLITALLPTWLGPRMRSLIKLALFSEPLFGGICTAVGHFPVYFKGSKAGDFGVDKEAQGKVAVAMDKFLREDGGLLIFPEGQLNKTPRKIQTLRRGAFNLAIAHKKPIWGFINVGCEKAWPYTSAMGGFPCDIYVRAFKVTDDASKFDNIQLADHAGKIMQEQLDEIYNIIDNKKLE
ncbi:unnamed protein product [Chondrus crispus]|uniref:Phospholipid/glycerol acyltransferase domain-containing protein n=1 Tax=Chondrus crispus TaxID=2769 RepID=R7Q157_CHOCR|nr:unnamed protein product [Chondrus crispus]CDF32362.1 unnamed protein product [Chondrus crispus]|eukprot:XP_005712027.1 unnamed protein product [Chondrus crispus]